MIYCYRVYDIEYLFNMTISYGVVKSSRSYKVNVYCRQYDTTKDAVERRSVRTEKNINID